MPRPRKVTDEGLAEIITVAKVRARIPSDKDLATRNHLSLQRVQQIMRNVRLKLVNPLGSTSNKLTEAELDALALEVHSKTMGGSNA